MSLLRVQTNFLVQLWRSDLAFQENLGEKAISRTALLNQTIEYAFNRRLMLAVAGSYRWDESRLGGTDSGGAPAAFLRLQLIENRGSSLAFTTRVGTPIRDLNERQTVVAFSLAGWQDLAGLGLGRTGLYWHLQEENFVGPEAPSRKRTDLTYAVALAHTWTSPESLFGNATTFVEAYGRTDLDGDRRGLTTLTLTPGVRATIAHRHIIMAGVEFPISDPEPFQRVVRVTYILNF